MKKPIAVVFGGTGFLGHAVVQELALHGYWIRVPTRNPSKAEDLKLLGTTGQIAVFHAHMPTDAGLAALIKGAEVVINLIGIKIEKKKNSFRVLHVELAARIARLARAGGVKHLIHVSTFGANTKGFSTYAKTKALGEEAVRAFFPKAVILRPNLMFGPRDTLFNRFANAARFFPFLLFYGGGKTPFYPLYVGDAARAILAGITKKEAQTHIYDLTGPQSYSLQEMMQLLFSTMGITRFLLPVPWWLLKLRAFFPAAPLTFDQIRFLQKDSRLLGPTKTIQDLGVLPKPLGKILSNYIMNLND